MKKSIWSDFRWANRLRWGQSAVIIVLTLTLIWGINMLSRQAYARKDLTTAKTYSLQPETLAHLQTLEHSVDVIVTFSEKTIAKKVPFLMRHLKQTLSEFEYHLKKNAKCQLNIYFLDPYEQTEKAKEVISKWGIQKENVITIASGERAREILPAELYQMEDGEVSEYKGEEVLVSSMVDVCAHRNEVVYFVTGHGEASVQSADPFDGVSDLASHLAKLANVKVKTLSLLSTRQVPEDASVVIIASPKTPFHEDEVTMLNDYLVTDKGALMVFLDPSKEHGLDKIMYEWGLQLPDAITLDTSNDFQTQNGSLLIKSFGRHDTTRFLVNHDVALMFSMARPVLPEPMSPNFKKLLTHPIVFSSATSWAEREYNDPGRLGYNEESDLKGPLPLGFVCEENVGTSIGLRMDRAKLIVLGNGGFISNNYYPSLGNSVFVNNLINWCLERGNLINIPPKKIERYQFTASKEEFVKLGIAFLVLPMLIALMGSWVTYLRSK